MPFAPDPERMSGDGPLGRLEDKMRICQNNVLDRHAVCRLSIEKYAVEEPPVCAAMAIDPQRVAVVESNRRRIEERRAQGPFGIAGTSSEDSRGFQQHRNVDCHVGRSPA